MRYELILKLLSSDTELKREVWSYGMWSKNKRQWQLQKKINCEDA